jgi:hypothetical protein
MNIHYDPSLAAAPVEQQALEGMDMKISNESLAIASNGEATAATVVIDMASSIPTNISGSLSSPQRYIIVHISLTVRLLAHCGYWCFIDRLDIAASETTSTATTPPSTSLELTNVAAVPSGSVKASGLTPTHHEAVSLSWSKLSHSVR